jgi:hypothetical protein
MYGIINQAIQGLVTDNFGRDVWSTIKQQSNISEETFLSNQLYDDEITYRLATVSAEVLNISVEQVLMQFGEYWILKIGKEKYGSLLKAGGNNFKEFLVNIPNFHSRVMLMYPKIFPPEFKITHETENSLYLHYYSERKGFTSFMHGLIVGLSKLYTVEVNVELLSDRNSGNDHDIFQVKWN